MHGMLHPLYTPSLMVYSMLYTSLCRDANTMDSSSYVSIYLLLVAMDRGLRSMHALVQRACCSLRMVLSPSHVSMLPSHTEVLCIALHPIV